MTKKASIQAGTTAQSPCTAMSVKIRLGIASMRKKDITFITFITFIYLVAKVQRNGR